MTRDRFVAVVWDDVRIDQADAFTRDEVKARMPLQFTTFGLLVRDDDKAVSVASEQCVDGTFRGITLVLRPLVREVIDLGYWPKGKKKPRKPAAPDPAATSHGD